MNCISKNVRNKLRHGTSFWSELSRLWRLVSLSNLTFWMRSDILSALVPQTPKVPINPSEHSAVTDDNADLQSVYTDFITVCVRIYMYVKVWNHEAKLCHAPNHFWLSGYLDHIKLYNKKPCFKQTVMCDFLHSGNEEYYIIHWHIQVLTQTGKLYAGVHLVRV